MKILCLSNGHGEDAIAVRILEQLQLQSDTLELAALPLVGEGHAYTQLGIPMIGSVQKMPSGGFVYMDGRQLWRDLQGGLLRLTLAQYKAIREWGLSQAESATVLAVGDIVPLLFAWLSGLPYAFVGTAKSEYYLQDEAGWLSQTSRLERWLGSVYMPWERGLMRCRRCKAVFPRDKLTTEVLQQYSVPAFDLGNPMMDGISPKHPGTEVSEPIQPLRILLLPGSRAPEAYRNWQQIIQAVAGVMSTFSEQPLYFLGAVAPALDLAPLCDYLTATGWASQPSLPVSTPIFEPNAFVFTQKNATLLLTQQAYHDCLLMADLAIAMAGTATEQFVGLGKPAITIPGKGPQFTPAFAEAQARLLGSSLILVEQPADVASVIPSLLHDPNRLQHIAENGRRRMGESGAAARIAHLLEQQLLAA